MARVEGRGPGRPRQPKTPQSKMRRDITLSQGTLDFIDWLIGKTGNLSGFLEEQAIAHPRYKEWQREQANKPEGDDNEQLQS